MWPPLAALKNGVVPAARQAPVETPEGDIRTPHLGMRKAAARAFALFSVMSDELSALEIVTLLFRASGARAYSCA